MLECCYSWPDELEDEIAAAIEGIETDEYAQGRENRLHRSKVPLDPRLDSQSLGHLLFTCDLVGVDGLGEGFGLTGGGIHEQQSWEVQIVLSYRLQASTQVEDAALAKRLAILVLKSVCPGPHRNRHTKEVLAPVRVRVNKSPERWMLITIVLTVSPIFLRMESA